MSQRTKDAMLVLLISSAVDWPLMLIGGEWKPHRPTEDDYADISPGSRYHKGKGFWSEWFRKDAEYWQKLTRFLIWWLTVFLLCSWLSH